MARRTFKYFTIAAGGTPQPVFGTTLGAALAAGPDRRSEAAGGAPNSILVADSSIFKQGDWAILDIPANGEDRILVYDIPDATHIRTMYPYAAHASGKYVRLASSVNAVYIQPLDGNADHLWIGTKSTMVKATGVSVFVKLIKVAAGVQPSDWSDPVGFPADAFTVGDYWIDGTTGDSYLPSFTQI